MNWITLALKNIKLILISIGIAALITSGIWIYFHGKSVQRMSTQIELLQTEIEQQKKVSEILNEVNQEYQKQRDEREKSLLESLRSLREVKENDEVSNKYLDQPIPDGVRTVRERARCLHLPYLCGETERDENSSD